MLRYEAVKQRLIRGFSDLLQQDRANVTERARKRRHVDQYWLRPFPPHQWIGRPKPHGGQFNLSCPVQHQHQTTAHHIAKCAIGLLPLPRFADFSR